MLDATMDEIGTIKYKNLGNLVQSTDPAEHESAVKRLFNIERCTQQSKPHIEVNEIRKVVDKLSMYGDTKSCQLLTNNHSKIRALDTPGFFSWETDRNIDEDVNFAIVQDIIYVQAIANLRIQRILYFLPQTGPLRRVDQTLLSEIHKLVKFFGLAIFKSMVLIATAPVYISEKSTLVTEDKFPTEELRTTQEYFHEGLKKVFEVREEDIEGLVEPPIVFIVKTDTCEEILEKVMSVPVESNDELQIKFNSKTCRRCAMEIGIKGDEHLICEYRRPGEAPWVDAIPYNKSYCHPKMQERRIRWPLEIIRFFGFEWHFTEFVCANPECKKGPGSFGCMQVGTWER